MGNENGLGGRFRNLRTTCPMKWEAAIKMVMESIMRKMVIMFVDCGRKWRLVVMFLEFSVSCFLFRCKS